MSRSRFRQAVVAVSSIWFLPVCLHGATYQVPGDFAQIQMAISNAAVLGDTVRVAPGRYVENLDFLGKDIVLTSHYAPGGDNSLIRETILDGGRNGAVVLFRHGETRAAKLNGFTVTNGSGYHSDILGSNGGGINIWFSSPTITNCRIIDNHSSGMSGGGGILVGYSNAYFAGLTITRNTAQNLGGGLLVGNSYLELDSLNRCSIYLNNASGYNDIYQTLDDAPSPRYFLDTASVDSVDPYFLGGSTPLVAHILHGQLTSVAHDLWVSPLGDDGNTGISELDPLKTIAHAFAIIEADSLHPRSIHLAPGTYSPSGGQLFPINFRSHVSLIGAGRDATILDLEYVYPRVLGGINRRDGIVRSLSILRTRREAGLTAISLMQCTGSILEDLRFAENEVRHLITGSYYDWMEFTFGSSLTLRDCLFEDNQCVSLVTSGWNQYVLVQNCRFDMTTPLENAPPDDIGLASAVGMSGFAGPFDPENYRHRIENCVFTRNTATYDWHYTFSPALNVRDYHNGYPLNIVNCTIADNSCPVSGGMWIDGGPDMQVRIANTLFWNNDPFELWLNGYVPAPDPPLQVKLSHCLVQGLEAGVEINGNAEVQFLEGNIDGDPLFLGTGDEPYRLTGASPAVDAGTAFWVVDGDTIVDLSQDAFVGRAPDIGAYEWIPTSIEKPGSPPRPDSFGITSISPNPFNPRTRIHFHLPTAGNVQLALYTLLGQRVEILADAWFSAGNHSIQFSAKGHASGLYIVEIRSEMESDRKLVTLVK